MGTKLFVSEITIKFFNNGRKAEQYRFYQEHSSVYERIKPFNITSHYLLLLLSSSSSSSFLSPLCRVFAVIHLKQTVSRVYSFAAVLYLQFVLHVALFRL